jgi:tetrahydromethanopterin S-methyltransferase subunit G
MSMVSLLSEGPVKHPIDETDPDAERLVREVVRLNSLVIGITFGVLCGWIICLATLWLVIKGGPQVGPHLSLLANYFPGYRVTFFGSFIGFGYGFLFGFIAGSLIAWLYNRIVWLRER